MFKLFNNIFVTTQYLPKYIDGNSYLLLVSNTITLHHTVSPDSVSGKEESEKTQHPCISLDLL